MPTLRAPTAPRSYWRLSRAPRYSLTFALPLLLAYESLAALLSRGPQSVRNGADVLIKGVFVAVGGAWGPLAFAALLVGIGVWLIGRDVRRNGRDLRGWVFGAMLAESVLLASVLGIVVGGITARLLHPLSPLAIGLAQGGPIEKMGWWTRALLSIGAGLYEELLFRVVLVGAIAWLGRSVLGLREWSAGALAAVVGAAVFSAFHYIGAYGDPFTLQSFVFRMIAGLAFSALYLLRGFGITAWSHALYDLFLLAL